MNRNQGITAGAILAAGLMLRPTASVAPTPMAEHGAETSASRTASAKSVEEGPWLASCKYWSPVRDALTDLSAKQTKVKVSILKQSGEVESETNATVEEDGAECPVDEAKGIDRWGFPTQGATFKPKIHAIIATVHDPVHTHLGLNFDREIDALVMAAGDNKYLPSYYWLPWKARAGALRAEAAAGTEVEHNATLEHQPGLIVFKRVHEPERNKDQVSGTNPGSKAAERDLTANYSDVVYLFLVGESPALGVDGFQLRNAFQYEQELSSDLHGSISLSMKTTPGSTGDVAIIGPTNSGSAASLRAAIEAATASGKLGAQLPPPHIDIAGSTQTTLAGKLLAAPLPQAPAPPGQAPTSQVKYISFSENWRFEEQQVLLSLACSGYHLNRIAELSEDGTVYGNFGALSSEPPADAGAVDESAVKKAKTDCLAGKDPGETPLVLRFPRNISLLRNAHPSGEKQQSPDKSTPTPFLHLSLRDPGTNDSVPQFSPDQMPLSQESQLMSISRLIERARVQFILIQASNVLDAMFLGQFLHRACPEARIVFIGGDLLFGRETENAPYVGTVTFSPYSLLNPTGTNVNGKVGALRAFPDSYTESYFNAASYTFWSGVPEDLHLANYRNPLQPADSPVHASLWATAIGTDGYYPLAIVDDCASDSSNILPTMAAGGDTFRPVICAPSRQVQLTPSQWIASVFRQGDVTRPHRHPGLSWDVICVCIGLLCFAHTMAVLFPRYWSPLTRDLVVIKGDQPHRRSMYIFIGTVMLFCMAFAAAYPVIPCFRMIYPDWWSTGIFSLSIFLVGALALVATFCKMNRFLLWRDAFQVRPENGKEKASQKNPPNQDALERFRHWLQDALERFRLWLTWNSHLPFNAAAAVTAIMFPFLWIYICSIETVGGNRTFLGPLFSYRCLYPGSGVCPLTPVLLILFGWYAWAVTQTLRLRFSNKNRPRLPGRVGGKSPWPLFVSDPDITECKREVNCCLESNLTCLLITRQALWRMFPNAKWWPTGLLLGIFVALYCLLMFGLKLGSMDRFVWQQGMMPTPYELLVGGIAYPLVMIALTAWLRMVLVWGSLKRGLLEPLEQLPLRYAFTRLKGLGWVEMMRQGGLLEQWRDMARSTESIRQMVHDPELREGFLPNYKTEWTNLTWAYDELNREISTIMAIVGAEKKEDLPQPLRDPQAGLNCMVAIEKCYAKACEALLSGVLIPYWEDARVGLVEGEELSELPVKARTLSREGAASRSLIPLQLHASTVAEEPTCIRVAEEFLAIRYVSLIRAVLVNMRRLLMIVSVVFVFTIIAWNSYPFQPRQWIDEAFTGLLLLLGAGVVWVFAQMHRSAILSRITDTNANELGWDFYLRLLTFGAVPVLTWLAYQFPEVGVSLFRFIQPGLEVMK